MGHSQLLQLLLASELIFPKNSCPSFRIAEAIRVVCVDEASIRLRSSSRLNSCLDICMTCEIAACMDVEESCFNVSLYHCSWRGPASWQDGGRVLHTFQQGGFDAEARTLRVQHFQLRWQHNNEY